MKPKHEDLAMAIEATTRSETMLQIFRIVRFAMLCTLAFAAVMLIADVGSRNFGSNRFLSEPVLMAVVYATAAEVIAAIAATTCLQLWKQ
jgi:hypothetical protein